MSVPSFITRDPQQVLSEMVAYYEAQTGRTLQPAQVERLLINAFAYRESLLREAIQDASLQNLVAFSRAPVLDYLGELVGVTRLAPQSASVTVRFTLTANVAGVTIPQGLRVASVDGQAVFATQTATVVPASQLVADVLCVAQNTGAELNGYAAGTITNIIDPQPFLSAASNTGISAGGASLESDDALRERIRLAPDAFSNAGSTGAYRFHARSANQGIIDVAVESTPGTGIVRLYPLMEDGQPTPSVVLAQVLAACNAERVRPLTDLVQVFSPTRINYVLQVNLVIFTGQDPTAIQAAVMANLQAYVDQKRKQLGQDITRSQVIREAQVQGVYSAALAGFQDVIIEPTEFGFCTSISVTITGTTNG